MIKFKVRYWYLS